MQNLKIDLIDILHNEDEKQEVVWMLNKIGYKTGYKSVNFYRYLYACGSGDDQYSKTIQFGNNAKTFRRSDFKEITLTELRDMVKSMKEYLNTNTYEYKLAHTKPDGDCVCIPDGANYAYKDEHNVHFTKLEMGYRDSVLIWVRPTHPEALPFIDDEPKGVEKEAKAWIARPVGRCRMAAINESLNDQYAEIEQVRQHRHYFKDVSNLNKIDVYMVLKLFNVTDPCLQHIVKKALCAGQRGHKDLERDLKDILDTAKRAVDINKTY